MKTTLNDSLDRIAEKSKNDSLKQSIEDKKKAFAGNKPVNK